MNRDILLSIVIPTRNRQELALRSIATALEVPGNDVEVVVYDSSDEPALGEILSANFSDLRLKYDYSPPPVSFDEAFDRGIDCSSGEYVCLIGDDDGVMPELREAAAWAHDHRIDAVSPVGVASYFWPDFRSRYYGSRHAGRMYLKEFTGTVQFPDPVEAVRKCLRSGGWFCEQFHLPKVYLALVSRTCLQAIRECGGGRAFRGASPDLYGAIALALQQPVYAEIDYPLIVGGNSGRSAAGLSATRKHVGELASIPLLRQFASLNWPPEIPAFYSVETVWGLAALLAAQSNDASDTALTHYSFARLYARCFLYHPNYANRIWASVRSGGIATAVRTIASLPGLLGERLLTIVRRLKHPGAAAGSQRMGPFQTIDEATQGLAAALRVRGANFTTSVEHASAWSKVR
jgi:glycosyltransferase involved in cell wall biosynthesis